MTDWSVWTLKFGIVTEVTILFLWLWGRIDVDFSLYLT